MFKDTLKLNRPIFVGMSILDLSKNLMYDFFYNHLKKQFDLNLLYKDTDSFLLHIKTEDVYKDIQKNIDQYDTSNFSKDHFLFSNENKKVLGKFKDELGGIPIKEYIGIRSKMYSIVSKEEIRKAKGIKKNIVKNELTHSNYRECLFQQKTFKHRMNMLRSYNHEIFGVRINKTSLSPFNSKRYIRDDGVDTYAFGHYKTEK